MKHQGINESAEATSASRMYAGQVIFLLYCALIGGAATYATYNSKVQIENAIHSHQSQTGRLISEWIAGSFGVTDYLLRDILGHVKESDLVYPSTNPEKQKQLSTLIATKMKSVDNAILVGLFDKNCVVTHANKTEPGWDGSQRDYCMSLRDNPNRKTFVTNGYVSSTGPLNITQSRRYLPDEPGFHGFAAVGVDLGFFSRWLEKIETGRTGFVSILDSRRMLLGSKPVIAESLGRTVDDTDLEAFIASDKTTATLIDVSRVDGIERYTYYQKVKDLPFIVVVGAGVSEGLHGWYQQLVMAAIGTVMLWLMGWIVWQKYQQNLRQNQALAEAANKERATRKEQEQLLYMIGHEVRTPISIISSAVDSLRLIELEAQSESPEKQRRYQKIHKAIKRMEILMQLIGSEQKMRRDAFKQTEREQLNFQEICEDNLSLLSDGGEVIHFEVHPLDHPNISGEAGMLGFLLLNLYDNAIKYTNGKHPINACIQQSIRNGVVGVNLSICNPSRPLAPSMEERIFHKFVRIDESRNHPGLGLGLYLARNIAEQHGGTLVARNGENNWVCFELWLPSSEGEAA